MPYVDGIPDLPRRSDAGRSEAADLSREIVSYQHPDHDTETWPPEGRT